MELTITILAWIGLGAVVIAAGMALWALFGWLVCKALKWCVGPVVLYNAMTIAVSLSRTKNKTAWVADLVKTKIGYAMEDDENFRASMLRWMKYMISRDGLPNHNPPSFPEA